MDFELTSSSSKDFPEHGDDPKRFDFSFAFDNSDFADRIVVLRISSEPESKCDTKQTEIILSPYGKATTGSAVKKTCSASRTLSVDSDDRLLIHPFKFGLHEPLAGKPGLPEKSEQSLPTGSVTASHSASAEIGAAASTATDAATDGEPSPVGSQIGMDLDNDGDAPTVALPLPPRPPQTPAADEGGAGTPGPINANPFAGTSFSHTGMPPPSISPSSANQRSGNGNSSSSNMLSPRDGAGAGMTGGVSASCSAPQTPSSVLTPLGLPTSHLLSLTGMTSLPGAGALLGRPKVSISPSDPSLSPSVAVRTVSLHLSSVVLAAKSSFFRSLFTCGLRETGTSSPVVLNVTPEEEGPMIELLRFIYTGSMSESSPDPEDLIKMFLVADKYGVSSCMKICLERLGSLSMTVSTACMYLSLPDSMHTHKGVAQLLEASRIFLVDHFRDLERVHKSEEFLDLPLVGLQTLLSSDELNVRDEAIAFHSLLDWVRHHHEDMEERRLVMTRLAEHIRFPMLTGDELEDTVLKAPEMDSPRCLELVREAAWFRSYSLVRRLRLMAETGGVHRRFWQRLWNRNCVGHVYFDIHLERFQALAVAATVESATFGIGGKRFYLSARHGRRDDGTETLDIHLHLENSHSVQPEIQVSFIFYAKRWPEGQFDYLRDRVTKGFGRTASNWGYSNILGKPWAEVVQNNSRHFNNGVMSVFAEVQVLEDFSKPSS